jgi:hypothetical protein
MVAFGSKLSRFLNSAESYAAGKMRVIYVDTLADWGSERCSLHLQMMEKLL